MPALVSQVVVLFGVALEVYLVWRLLRSGLSSQYPYFAAYLFCVVVRTVILLGALWCEFDKSHPDTYANYYWTTETAGVALRCLVVWELFRHAFPSGSVLRERLSRAFGILALGLLALTVAAIWSYMSYARLRSLNLALDRSFGFAQAILILTILLISRHYGIRLGKNLWGIAVGFGAWLSISTVNYAMFDLTGLFLPYWQILRPLSFLGLLVVWAWAVFQPSQLSSVTKDPLPAGELDAWADDWHKTLASLRKAKP